MAPRKSALPSLARLFSLAVSLPAAVAATNYALLFGSDRDLTRGFLYPEMALSAAIVSWCVGRYLWPAWLRWSVFVWALLLLDLMTIAACLGGPVRSSFGYVLVTAQIGFLVLWAILGPQRWQWRLPIVIVAAAIVVGFSGSFDRDWSSQAWSVMMFLAAVLVAMLCGGLRWLGFSLRRGSDSTPAVSAGHGEGMYQFGTRHMMIWAAAIAPLLLVARGLDIVFLKVFDAQGTLPAGLLVVALATVCLIAIWAVLGNGNLLARTVALLLIPPALGAAMRFVSDARGTQANRWQSRILSGMDDIGNDWVIWMGLTAALLAALLLFLRADGYLLTRIRSQGSS
jgi:hypothetical protein